MINIRNIIFFSLLLINYQNAGYRDESHIKTFNLKELPKITSVKLSDLGFADIKYIPLETNERNLIKRITDIKTGKDFLIIQYYTTIFKFTPDGLFIKKIGTEGRGPNEFTVVHDLDIDNINQDIYLVSAWQRKFFVYSENGEFIRTFQSPLNTTHFRVTEEGILCYSINSFANIENSYNLIDTKGELIKYYPNKYPWQLNQKYAFVFQYENLFYRFNNMLYKKEVYSDAIYSFEKKDFKPHLIIEHGKKLITPKARTDYTADQIRDNFIRPLNLFEFGNYIYYEFLIGHDVFSYIGSKKNDVQFLINPEQGLLNDLDGGPNIWPKTIWDDNTIIGCVDVLKLKKLIASETFKNSTPKYPEKKKELEKLANSLKETDNPVLILVRLKQ